MKPFSQHTNFFSSLKQVEKRLKSEDPSPLPLPPSPPPEINNTSTESLSTPIYLNFDQSITATSSTLSDSEPPQAFLSQFALTQQQQQQAPSQINDPDHGDDIQRLMQLLGLSDVEDREEEESMERGGNGNSCKCGGGFYDKIVGVKGPKCKKEVERLEGWIKHFANGGREPLRLAHLLLGKAAFYSKGQSGAYGGLEFPSTIVEFLENDNKTSNKIEERKR